LSTISFPLTPACPGTHSMSGRDTIQRLLALLYQRDIVLAALSAFKATKKTVRCMET
jgi:hypothetical protein